MSERRGLIPPHVLWPGIVVGLMSMSFVLCGVTVYFAVSDPSFAVEKDYYERGLRWDERAAQERVNERLGWAVEASLGPLVDGGRARELRITLVDRDGVAIEDAAISAEVFHHVRSGDRRDVAFDALDAGRYVVRGPMLREGIWAVRCTIRRGGDVFTCERTVTTPGGER